MSRVLGLGPATWLVCLATLVSAATIGSQTKHTSLAEVARSEPSSLGLVLNGIWWIVTMLGDIVIAMLKLVLGVLGISKDVLPVGSMIQIGLLSFFGLGFLSLVAAGSKLAHEKSGSKDKVPYPIKVGNWMFSTVYEPMMNSIRKHDYTKTAQSAKSAGKKSLQVVDRSWQNLVSPKTWKDLVTNLLKAVYEGIAALFWRCPDKPDFVKTGEHMMQEIYNADDKEEMKNKDTQDFFESCVIDPKAEHAAKSFANSLKITGTLAFAAFSAWALSGFGYLGTWISVLNATWLINLLVRSSWIASPIWSKQVKSSARWGLVLIQLLFSVLLFHADRGGDLTRLIPGMGTEVSNFWLAIAELFAFHKVLENHKPLEKEKELEKWHEKKELFLK